MREVPKATITVDDWARIGPDIAEKLRSGRDDIVVTIANGHPNAIERINSGRLPVFTCVGVPIFIGPVTANLPPVLAALVARWLN